MFEVRDRVYVSNWGCGIVAGTLEHGALVSIENSEHKGIYYFYFDELEKAD